MSLGLIEVETPDILLDLRHDVSDLLAAEDPNIAAEPAADATIQKYATVTSDLWAEAAVRETTAKYGEDVEEVGRGALIMRCGSIVQQAARIEADEISRIIDSRVFSKRQRIAKKVRGFFRTPDVPLVESKAFSIFDEELNEEKRGEIRTPEDLRPVVKRSAQRFITGNVAGLYEG